MKFNSFLLLLAFLVIAGVEARISGNSRELETDYVSLYARCCGEVTSACKCPVRDWGLFSRWWSRKCDKIADKIAE